jgi:hypothetical protein
MAEPTATFKAIEHTADLGVEITASSLLRSSHFRRGVVWLDLRDDGCCIAWMEGVFPSCWGIYRRIRSPDHFLTVDLQLATNRFNFHTPQEFTFA